MVISSISRVLCEKPCGGREGINIQERGYRASLTRSQLTIPASCSPQSFPYLQLAWHVASQNVFASLLVVFLSLINEGCKSLVDKNLFSAYGFPLTMMMKTQQQ